MAEARRVIVTGHVQGVFFRAWTRQQAEELGLSGWVRNRDDGSVEAIIEGPSDRLDTMLDRMRQGPDHATVEGLDVSSTPPTHRTGFIIRH